jgi:hypothetical protein
LGLFLLLSVVIGRPGHALPAFARQYQVGCETCHSVPPRLNAFGEAFQANHFNWPGAGAPVRKSGLASVPTSAMATFSYSDNRSRKESSAAFRELELFLASGFRTGQERPGGFCACVIAATSDDREKDGDLADLFVSLPVAGRRGQWAVTMGQSTPLIQQWWHHTRLTSTPPAALSLSSAEHDSLHHEDEDDPAHVAHEEEGSEAGHPAFSFSSHQPSIRLDYFSARGEGTADGHYLTVGVPFEGRLALNRGSRLAHAHGLFVHAFERRAQDTLGGFAYANGGERLLGVIGTRQILRNVSLLGIGSVGENDEGPLRRLSLEGEYVANQRMALTARLEALGGHEDDLGAVAALTYYPLPLPVLRLTLESAQRKGDRSLSLFARGQF